MRQLKCVAAGIILLTALSVIAMGQTAELVSVNKTGTGSGNRASEYSVVSANGRYVAFSSEATNLDPNIIPPYGGIYVRDLQTGTTTLVSVNDAGVSANFGAYHPSISADGRYVAFTSLSGNLVPNDIGSDEDIFVRDLQAGTTKMLSFNGTEYSSYRSYNATITPNGRYVVFVSTAPLVGRDTNNADDIFVRDLVTGTLTLVSINSAGTAAGDNRGYVGQSFHPVITPDGRFVAFQSFDTDLASYPPSNGTTQVYVRDLVAKQTKMVSVNRVGTGGANYGAGNPLVSADGRYVIFTSESFNLVAGDLNGEEDIFVRDLLLDTTAAVSVNKTGTGTANAESNHASISANGLFVAFTSEATDLVDEPINNIDGDVFVRDIAAGKTTLVSINSAGTGSGISPSDYARLSADGRFVAFLSVANDLVMNDIQPAVYGDVFVRDLVSRTTSLVTINSTGNGSGNGASGFLEPPAVSDIPPSISANGRVISFASQARNLVTNDINGRLSDVFVVNTAGGTLQLSGFTYSAKEGGGSIKATVQRTGGLSGAVTVDYATIDDTARAGRDYTATAGTLSFASGERAKIITIPLINDAIDETDKRFYLSLSHPTNHSLAGARTRAMVTILDDDLPPALSITDQSVIEGNTLTSKATFTVKLSSASSFPITVHFSTANDTATVPNDYTAVSGTLSFAPGVTSKTISVQVKGDTQPEANETFKINLSAPTNATIIDGLGVGTILNDD